MEHPAVLLFPAGFVAVVLMAALWAFTAKRAASSPQWQVLVASGTAAIWFAYCGLVLFACV